MLIASDDSSKTGDVGLRNDKVDGSFLPGWHQPTLTTMNDVPGDKHQQWLRLSEEPSIRKTSKFLQGQPYLRIIAKPAKNCTTLKTGSNLEVLLFSMIFFTSSFLYIWVEKKTQKELKGFAMRCKTQNIFTEASSSVKALFEKWQLRQVEQRYFISFKTINKHTFSKNSVHTRERQLHEQSPAWACKTHSFQWAWKLL